MCLNVLTGQIPVIKLAWLVPRDPVLSFLGQVHMLDVCQQAIYKLFKWIASSKRKNEETHLVVDFSVSYFLF